MTRTLIVNEQVTHEAVRSYLSAYAPIWDARGLRMEIWY